MTSANAYSTTGGRPDFSKNLTTAFLYPLTGISYDLSMHPDVWLFLHKEPEGQRHSLVFKCLNSDLYTDWLATYNRPYPASQWFDEEGHCALVELTEEEETQIIDPFLKGKFSEMASDLINSYPRLVNTGRLYTLRGSVRKVQGFSLQRKVCLKSPSLKDFWEEYLDVKLPEGAEVWSKPEVEHEYYSQSETSEQSDSDQPGRPGPAQSPEL